MKTKNENLALALFLVLMTMAILFLTIIGFTVEKNLKKEVLKLETELNELKLERLELINEIKTFGFIQEYYEYVIENHFNTVNELKNEVDKLEQDVDNYQYFIDLLVPYLIENGQNENVAEEFETWLIVNHFELYLWLLTQ